MLVHAAGWILLFAVIVLLLAATRDRPRGRGGGYQPREIVAPPASPPKQGGGIGNGDRGRRCGCH